MKPKNIVLIIVLFIIGALQTPYAMERCIDDQCKDILQGEIPYEPSVTEKEGELLRRIIDLSQHRVGEAITVLEEALLPDSSVPLYFALGTLYHSQDNLVKAESYFRQALQKEEHFLKAKGSLAQVLIQQGKVEEALVLFKDVLLYGRPKPSTFTMVGYAYLMKDQPVPAENAYRQALLMDPDENAYMGLAQSLVLQERYREAAVLLKQLIESSPYKKELWLMLSNLYLSLGEHDRAISILESARRLELIDQEGLATLGDLYVNREMLTDAFATYQEAFQDTTIDVTRILRAAEGFIIHLDTESAGQMLQLIKRYPLENKSLSCGEKETLFLLQARCAHIDRQFSEAVWLYQELLEMNPVNAQVLMACGDLYREQEEFEKALLYYERAERLGGVAAKSLLRQAQIEVEREHYQQAVMLLEEAQRIDPDPFVGRYLTQIRNLIN